MIARLPTNDELRLLRFLIRNASGKITLAENWETSLEVQNLNDGGMGSLLLLPEPRNETARRFGSMVSDYQFTDVDGVEVIASLYLDEQGKLFELDVWKTDFGKLLQLPRHLP